MDSFYSRFIEKENAFYRTLMPSSFTADIVLDPSEMDGALNWLIEGSHSVVDFGCGSGTLAILCALRGVSEVIGIDLAEDGINYARRSSAALPQCRFLHGSIGQLQLLPEAQYDGVILSNILDNLKPEDAMLALEECFRILKPRGKILLKLNPYLSQEQIENWKIQVIRGDLLDDGMLLWNKDDAFWKGKLSDFFCEVRQLDVYFKEINHHNRMFLCVK